MHSCNLRLYNSIQCSNATGKFLCNPVSSGKICRNRRKNIEKFSGTMRIIVAIDIIGGKCVRLTRGDFNTKKVYNIDPLDVARQIEDNGINFLHLVDLDGAKNKKIENIKVLEKIAGKTKLKIDFGGGLRTFEDLITVFNAGARQVTVGSIALTDPPLFIDWLKKLGQEKLILGADCINRKVSTGAWLEDSENEITGFIADY